MKRLTKDSELNIIHLGAIILMYGGAFFFFFLTSIIEINHRYEAILILLIGLFGIPSWAIYIGFKTNDLEYAIKKGEEVLPRLSLPQFLGIFQFSVVTIVVVYHMFGNFPLKDNFTEYYTSLIKWVFILIFSALTAIPLILTEKTKHRL